MLPQSFIFSIRKKIMRLEGLRGTVFYFPGLGNKHLLHFAYMPLASQPVYNANIANFG